MALGKRKRKNYKTGRQILIMIIELLVVFILGVVIYGWYQWARIGHDKLELEADSDDIIFRMTTDETMSELVFYACDFSGEKAPGFSRIDKFIKQNVQITTDSVFTEPGTGKYYRTIHIEKTDQVL